MNAAKMGKLSLDRGKSLWYDKKRQKSRAASVLTGARECVWSIFRRWVWNWRYERERRKSVRVFCVNATASIGVWRCFTISKKEMQLNEEIREKEVRLLGPENEALGFMSSKEALELAVQKNLDLVMIAPTATPPVCRIMDYGKYRFEQAKRDKEARKKQKVIEIKEVRMSLNIDVHDFNTKANQAIRFLSGGDRVKVSIRFRGRELAHTNLGNGVMERFAQACSETGNVEKPPKMEGRSMVMFLSPKPTK